MVTLTTLKEAFKETEKWLDRIIAGYSGKDIAKTYAYYSDGSVVKYDIAGTLNSSSINKTNLVKVDIGNTVTDIGEEAFYECSSLSSITIPESITSIGDSAFSYCSELTSITIPVGVTSIGNGAFEYCSGLTSVSIPNSVTSIGHIAFYDCSGLTSVTIPDSVTSIGDSAFYGCSGLTSIVIPDSVTSIGDSVFHGCSGVTEISVLGTSTNIGYSAFYVADPNNNYSLQTVYFPNLTMAEVEAMSNYPWDIPAGIPIVCKDGEMPTPESGGDDSSSQ